MPYKDPEQKRQHQRELVSARRAAWFADKVCVDCGSVENLELDHTDKLTKDSKLKGKTSNGIHRGTGAIWTWSAARREVELAKCVARCHSCHRVKSVLYGDHSNGIVAEHGRDNTYKSGCRCVECTEAHRVNARREYRIKYGGVA